MSNVRGFEFISDKQINKDFGEAKENIVLKQMTPVYNLLRRLSERNPDCPLK